MLSAGWDGSVFLGGTTGASVSKHDATAADTAEGLEPAAALGEPNE